MLAQREQHNSLTARFSGGYQKYHPETEILQD